MRAHFSIFVLKHSWLEKAVKKKGRTDFGLLVADEERVYPFRASGGYTFWWRRWGQFRCDTAFRWLNEGTESQVMARAMKKTQRKMHCAAKPMSSFL